MKFLHFGRVVQVSRVRDATAPWAERNRPTDQPGRGIDPSNEWRFRIVGFVTGGAEVSRAPYGSACSMAERSICGNPTTPPGRRAGFGIDVLVLMLAVVRSSIMLPILWIRTTTGRDGCRAVQVVGRIDRIPLMDGCVKRGISFRRVPNLVSGLHLRVVRGKSLGRRSCGHELDRRELRPHSNLRPPYPLRCHGQRMTS